MILVRNKYMDYNNVIELDEVTLEDCIDLYEKKIYQQLSMMDILSIL